MRSYIIFNRKGIKIFLSFEKTHALQNHGNLHEVFLHLFLIYLFFFWTVTNNSNQVPFGHKVHKALMRVYHTQYPHGDFVFQCKTLAFSVSFSVLYVRIILFFSLVLFFSFLFWSFLFFFSPNTPLSAVQSSEMVSTHVTCLPPLPSLVSLSCQGVCWAGVCVSVSVFSFAFQHRLCFFLSKRHQKGEGGADSQKNNKPKTKKQKQKQKQKCRSPPAPAPSPRPQTNQQTNKPTNKQSSKTGHPLDSTHRPLTGKQKKNPKLNKKRTIKTNQKGQKSIKKKEKKRREEKTAHTAKDEQLKRRMDGYTGGRGHGRGRGGA